MAGWELVEHVLTALTILLRFRKKGNAVFDGNQQCLDGRVRSGDFQHDNGCGGIEGFRLVENEIAETVENGTAAIGFDSLESVCVLADHDVCTCIDDAVSRFSLFKMRRKGVFNAPMKAHDDVG